MYQENALLVQRWFDEVWNGRRDDLLEEFLSADSVAHGLPDAGGKPPGGHEGFRELFYAFTTAFPNLKIVVEDMVCENDKVVARCTVKGTHRGEGLGVAPTDRVVEFAGLCMMRIENGKIVEVWNQFDFMNMYQQLGALSLTMG